MRVYVLRLKGRAKHVFDMLKLLAITEPIEQDRDWWRVRAYILAHDMDKQPSSPVELRNN